MKHFAKILLLAGALSVPVFGLAATTKGKIKTSPAANSTPVASASSPTAAATALVNKVLNGQATIQQTFLAANGMIGFVVHSSQGNNGIVYADAQGQYLFIGSIINNQGQDLTQVYTNEYINSKLAGPAYQKAASMNWFSEGSDKAPHKLYIIIDPNCIYCHVLYQQIEPLITSNQLQVRWIPVAFRDPSSPGKAAAMLNAGSDAAADKLLAQNENGFDDQTESGALTPLVPNADDPVLSGAFSKVAQNTAFFSQSGFQGTPTILYKQEDGTVMMVPGMPRGQAFTDMINSVGSNW